MTDIANPNQTRQNPELPENFYIKNGCVYSTQNKGTPKEFEQAEGVPVVIFAREFNLGNESNFYDISLYQQTINKDALKDATNNYEGSSSLHNLVSDIERGVKSQNGYDKLSNLVIRTFAVETNDKRFHTAKVRLMLDYIISLDGKIIIATSDIGRLFDDLGETKFIIEQMIKREKIEIYFSSPKFHLDRKMLSQTNLFEESCAV